MIAIMDRAIADSVDDILEAIHEDLLITDGSGKVLKVSATFEDTYGIREDEAVGQTVYELEKKGVFSPSIIAEVIKAEERITMQQKTATKRDILVTATPIYDENHRMKLVVSFSRDITEMLDLQKRYSTLESKIKKYTDEIKHLRKDAAQGDRVVWNSAAMQRILDTIEKVAVFDANILFLGASGVGKTMLAKIVHQNSPRRDGPFIDINCAAIPENLLESELFGYEKGSFTGASTLGKVGLIELANGGTLLLDEISEMPQNLQAKLLKVIQDKVITRVGGIREIKVDFRLIAATNQDLEKLSDQGQFRKDLFYRLNVVNINIPSMAERKEDIIPLIHYFLNRINEKYDLDRSFHPRAIERLLAYSWPGNVRELANVVERASMTCDKNTDLITTKDLPAEILRNDKVVWQPEEDGQLGLEETLTQIEARIIQQTYKKYGTTVGVASALKISQPTAHRKINKYIKK